MSVVLYLFLSVLCTACLAKDKGLRTNERQPHATVVVLGRRSAFAGLFLLPEVDLFEQGIHHLIFLNPANDLAAAEDHALALAGGDADVRLAGLAGAVDDATQHADLDGDRAAA